MQVTAYIGNVYYPVDIVPSIGRSAFQTAYIQRIAQDPNTDFLCCDAMCDKPYKGPFLLSFFTRDGKLNSHWVGRTRVLSIRKQK